MCRKIEKQKVEKENKKYIIDEMRKIVLSKTDYFEKGQAKIWKYEDH
mgnify:CR=1 FL=1